MTKHFAAPTKTIWILVDASNSNQRSKNYLWWFETRQLARDFLAHHKALKDVPGTYGSPSNLIGPFKYKQA